MLDRIAALVTAYVEGNQCRPDDVPRLILLVHETMVGFSRTIEATDKEPAVDPKRSIKHDFLICLEDGKQLKTLKRYLRRRHNLTPDQYRHKWGLPHDYPLVSPAYAEQRSALAKKFGLGRNPNQERPGRRRKQV
jgi:predicted transcriptional regulator